MKKLYTHLSIISIFFSLIVSSTTTAQSFIDWQKSIGTPGDDVAVKIFNDQVGNLVVMGSEPHADFAGNVKNYMLITKLDAEGNEMYKKYHDVPFETFSLPLDYYFGRHFYTTEFGEKLINVLVSIGDRVLLYKMLDQTGEYWSYEEVGSHAIYVADDNTKVITGVLCSIQQSCYGPDSLVVEKINPVPDSLFNFVDWRFEMKQNIRTNPIQGHYDFDNNDVTMDEEGNVYLLTQIERWDFQFCTDCADAFIDAFCEIFKFDTNGVLVKHVKLKTSKAVVSEMEFLKCADGDIVVRINDINASNTALLTSVYRLDYDLTLEKEFTLDQSYNHMVVDEELNIIGCTNVFDPNDPNIKGASDALVTKYNKEGVFQWKSYYGGTSFDFPRGVAITADGGIAFIANTSSTDFDIAENHGFQDIWVVKLTEGTTGYEDAEEVTLSMFPNPTTEYIHIASNIAVFQMRIVDLFGKEVLKGAATHTNTPVDVRSLPLGTYFVQVVEDGWKGVGKFVKL